MLVVGRQCVALGAAAGRPRDVQTGRRGCPAGQNEALQHRQVGVEVIAELLEAIDVGLLDAEPVADAEWDRQVGADVEEVVLDALERRVELLGQAGVRQHNAERRIQLVDRAEGADAAVELGHTRAVAERRLPFVARARVDACQADGLVALTT